jgi:hypothetical protein
MLIRNLVNEETQAHWGLLHQKKERKKKSVKNRVVHRKFHLYLPGIEPRFSL